MNADIIPTEKEKDIDPANINVFDHVLIRDKDTKEILINKRDVPRK